LNDHYKTIGKTLKCDIQVAKRTNFNTEICNSREKN